VPQRGRNESTLTTNTQFYGWKLLSVLWLIMFINLGFPAYGQSVVNTVMALEFKLDRASLGLLFSAYIGMTGVAGPLAGFLINRLGVRRTLLIGSALIASAAVLMATVVASGLQAGLVLGLMLGSGVSIGAALAAQAGIARWFVRRRALALAILYSASAIGGFAASPFLNHVIRAAQGNWRMAWWVIAALSVFAGVLAALFVREQPSDLGQVPDGAAADASGRSRPIAGFITTEPWTSREALLTPAYWLMVLSLVGGSCGYTLYLAHGIVHLQDLGHTREQAAWAVGIVAATGLSAKVVVAVLGDRIDPRYLWAIFTAFFALGLYLVIDARDMTRVFAFAMCIGIGFGGGLVCLMTVLSNYYGNKAFAMLAGVAVTANTLPSVAAPYIAGRLYDSGYGYGSSFITYSLWCVVGTIVLFVVQPPTRGVRRVAAAETP